MVIVGHRGAGKLAKENSLEGFRKAIGLGLKRTELDVRLSKDKQVVVVHDPEINGKKIYELNSGEIDAPLLQEVIELCKGKIDLQIELKGLGALDTDFVELPQKVEELVVKKGMVDEVLITSFDLEMLRNVKNLKTGLLFDEEPTELGDFDYICPKSSIVTKEMIEKAHSLGKKVYAFHVPTKEIGEKLLEMGVDDLGTDYPELLINFNVRN